MELFCEYFKKDHVFSGVDARIKLIITIALLMMVLSYQGIGFPLLVTLASLLLCLRMRIPLKILALRFAEPAIIASVILILKTFFSGDKNGGMEGIVIAGRIFGAASLVVFLGFSTLFSEFMAGLLWFKAPKIFVEILMFSYRYVFMLFEDALVIYHAQKNRLGFSNIQRGMNSFAIMGASLVLKAFEQSQNTTQAMLQRGYTGEMPMAQPRQFKKGEIIVAVLIIAAMGALWKIK